MDILAEILRDSNYALTFFDPSEILALKECVTFREVRGIQKPYVVCLIRDKEILLKPEEVIRQLYLSKLINQHKYPQNRITVEHPVSFGRETKSADIVIFDKDHPTVEYIIVELKKPKLQDGKSQHEGKSLKTIIQDMENEVLANVGVDVFEEVFKLIFTKLYDEIKSQKDKEIINYFLNSKNLSQVADLKTKHPYRVN